MSLSYSSNQQSFDLLPQNTERFCGRGLFGWLFQKVKVSRMSFFPSRKFPSTQQGNQSYSTSPEAAPRKQRDPAKLGCCQVSSGSSLDTQDCPGYSSPFPEQCASSCASVQR